MKIRINGNIFNPVYKTFAADYSKRHEVWFGSAGSGKSHFVAQKLLIKALTTKRKVLVLRKVDKTSKDSTWALMMEIINQFKLQDIIQVRIADMRIVFPNGSEMLFRGLQDPERIKSIAGITDIWFEEATEFTAEDANQLDLRLRSLEPNLQMFYTYNPVSKSNWVYKRWHEEGVIIPADTRVMKTTYHDNNFLPQSYKDSMESLKLRDIVMYRIYALGEFASLGRRIYTNWKVDYFDPTEIEMLPIYLGMDFGFNDPTTLAVVRVDSKNKKMYFIDEFSQPGMFNETIADMITAKGYRKAIITADAAEPKTIQELRTKYGIEKVRAAKKGPDSIRYGIRKIQQYELLVSPSCEKTIIELENYTWKKDKSGEYIDQPIDEHNHILDALRYAVEDVDKPANKARVFDKALLGL